jgi:hypothetical protein
MACDPHQVENALVAAGTADFVETDLADFVSVEQAVQRKEADHGAIDGRSPTPALPA